jgi:GT2 family glycosyltransferase
MIDKLGTKKRSVATAIITRGRPVILRQCLGHLRQQTEPPEETVVVDSSDDTQSRDVCSAFREVNYVRFAGGRHQMPASRNLAMNHSSAEILAYVDDDCLVDPDWLERLRDTYRQYPEVAGVGGRITDARWAYDPSCPIGQVDSLGRVTCNFFGDPGGAPAVDILPGGNMSFRREWLAAVGGFDPGFTCTNHREEADLCLRIRRQGGILRYQPSAHAVHLNARNALGELQPWHEFFLRYSFSRNETYFVIKQFGHNWRAVRRTLLSDSIDFLHTVVKSRSPALMATVPVFAVAKTAGLAAGCRYRLRFRRGRSPDHLRSAVLTRAAAA